MVDRQDNEGKRDSKTSIWYSHTLDMGDAHEERKKERKSRETKKKREENLFVIACRAARPTGPRRPKKADESNTKTI